jgi:transcription elongation factor SPT4
VGDLRCDFRHEKESARNELPPKTAQISRDSDLSPKTQQPQWKSQHNKAVPHNPKVTELNRLKEIPKQYNIMSYNDHEDDRGEEEEDEVPQQVAELAQAVVPSNLRGIRACKRCGLLKTQEQFYEDGCENCPFLDLQDDMERVNGCTTAFFEGQAAVMDPRESWAAKWIRVDAYLPGVYAIAVTGQLDRDIEEDLENRGIRWRCRPVAN